MTREKVAFETLAKYKLAYMYMRKSGSTSVAKAMSELRRENLWARCRNQLSRWKKKVFPLKYHYLDHELACDRMNPDDWYKFTIVREPITRFLSFYCNKILDQNILSNPTIRQRNRYGYFPNMPIECAVDSLVDPRFQTEPHAIPQSDLIDLAGFDLDHIGKLEQIESCIQNIEQNTGAQLKLDRQNPRNDAFPSINRRQFERLAEYYSNDLKRFDYPMTYDQWRSDFVTPNPRQFKSELGFVFGEEAKMLTYSVERNGRWCTIDLHWRVFETQSRTRFIRVVCNNGRPQRHVLFHLKACQSLTSQCDQNMEAHERLTFDFSRVPQHLRDRDLYFEVFFWNEEKQIATVPAARTANKILIAIPSDQDIRLGLMKSVKGADDLFRLTYDVDLQPVVR